MLSAPSSRPARAKVFHVACAQTAAHAQAWKDQNGSEPLGCNFAAGNRLGLAFVRGILDQGYAGANPDGLALRAYRDHFGKLRDRPRFVVPADGYVRADLCAAMATLSGVIPITYDLTKLMKLIDRRQADRLSVHLEDEMYGGNTLLVWEMLSGSSPVTDIAYVAGIQELCNLLTPLHPINMLRDLIRELERQRLEATAKAAATMGSVSYTRSKAALNVTFIRAPIGLDGWDRWFDLGPCVLVFREPPVWTAQIAAPAVAGVPAVVPATPPAQGRMLPRTNPAGPATTVAGGAATSGAPAPPPPGPYSYLELRVRNGKLAEDMFGPDGLIEVLSQLQPPGWKGNKTAARCPAGPTLAIYEGRTVAQFLQQHIDKRTGQKPTP